MPFPEHIRLTDYTHNHPPKWGDVYWYHFGTPRGQQHTMAQPHPALVVSDTKITLKGTTLIIPLSGAEHRRNNYAFHILVPKTEYPALDKDSIVKVDQVYCVPTDSLPDQYYITRFSKKTMARVIEPLLRVLGLHYILEG